MKVIEYIKLIRAYQWYKNLVIFLALFFIGELFHTDLIVKTIIGFAALCLISSTNYVINDIIDLKNDRAHPERRSRPLAKGTVTIAEAWIIAIVLAAAAFWIAYTLGIIFFCAVLLLFLLTTAYSLFLKNEPIADVLVISINFVIRAVSGAFLITYLISPWLILCPFFLALFLAIGKREADIKLLNEKAHEHKQVLRFYSLKLTNALMIISLACLIIVYSLYSLTKTTLMLITVPIAIYAIFRYYYLIQEDISLARNPEKAYKDWRLVLSVLLWIVITFVIFYFASGNTGIASLLAAA